MECRVWARFIFVIAMLLGAAVARAMPAPSPKTLTRFHDPVILSTSLLHDLADHRTANYRLYSARSGVLAPIPYQFDERDDGGDLVFPDSDTSQEFTFDDNDELVFMAKDSGDRVAHAALPPSRDTGVEIEATDPATGEHGWAYLLHFPDHPPPASPITYARFDPKTNQVRSLFYTMEYHPDRAFFTGMRIAPAAGGTGENVLDRMKIRVNPTFSLLLTTWSPLFTEEDFSVKIDGVKNGPVRAIRRVRQWLDLGKFLPEAPSGTVYTYYYFSSFVTPSKFSVPWLALKALRSFRFVGVSDFRKNVIGMKYWDGANLQGVSFTGHNHLTMNTTQDHDWWVVSGTDGTCLQVFITPMQWQEWGIARGTVFADDDTAVDREGQESEPGSHAAGYSLLNMTNLRQAGTYDVAMATIFLQRPYEQGDEAKPLAMLKQPLKATAQPIE
jgi:hypothetical protein